MNELLKKSKKKNDFFVGKSEESKKLKGMLVRKAKKLIKDQNEKGGKAEQLDENDKELIEKTIATKLMRKKKIFKQNQVVEK